MHAFTTTSCFLPPCTLAKSFGGTYDGAIARIGLGPVLDLITRRRNSVFGHIARLSEDTSAHQALRCHVDLTLGHLPDQSWKRRPGRPNNRWIDQLRRDNNNTPPAELWRRSTTRGHSGVTLRSSTSTR